MFLGTLIEKVKNALQSQVCLRCEQKLGASGQYCASCGEVLEIREPGPIIDTDFCRTHAATRFNPAVKKFLYGHKFYKRTDYIPQLSGLLIQYWEGVNASLGLHAVHPENVLVAPIPPHAGKISLIDVFANRFARHFGFDYQHDLLSWMREVHPQHHIHDKQRRFRNVAQSLRFKSGLVSGYEKIIVVDDLTTTGATLLEAGRAFQDEVGQQANRRKDLICLAVSHVPIGAQLRSGAE